MSEKDARRDPLAAITYMEAAAFRISRIARQLIAEHGDAIGSAAVHVSAYPDSDGHHELVVEARDLDVAHRLATAHGVELEFSAVKPGWPRPFRLARGSVVTDGVTLTVRATARLTDDEAAAEGGGAR